MPLFNLPPEILNQIFGECGASFFRRDIRRLTVCKRWLTFAHPVLFRRLKLSQKSLHRLYESGGPSSVAAVHKNLRSIDVGLSDRPHRQNPDPAKVGEVTEVDDGILPFCFFLVQD